jgi:cytosine/adenosine deaminase-related metal-dependent hydrolase
LATTRWLLDGTGRLIEDGGLLVREGRIAAVGPTRELESRRRDDGGLATERR